MHDEDCEWDEAKRASTLVERGLDFADAWQVFRNVHLSHTDMRHEYGEDRTITVGLLDDGVEVVLCHTQRLNKKRIISMRKANARERERFWRRLEQG